MELIRETMRDWYLLLSQVSIALSVPVKELADWVQIPSLKEGVMLQWIAGFFVLAFLTSPSWVGAADPYEAFAALRIEKKPAPDFSLPAVNGKIVQFSDYKDKVVLLGFFKTF